MMRRLFILSTVAFWLAIAAFGAANVLHRPDASGPALVPAGAAFTLVELARHDKAADCWMAIDGAVYNLTAYLPQHPSDPAVILPWCGKDATAAYHTKTKGRPHSSRAINCSLRFKSEGSPSHSARSPSLLLATGTRANCHRGGGKRFHGHSSRLPHAPVPENQRHVPACTSSDSGSPRRNRILR